MTIIVGITGASGSLIASKTIEELLDRNIPTSVVASGPAKMVWKQEMQDTVASNLSIARNLKGNASNISPPNIGHNKVLVSGYENNQVQQEVVSFICYIPFFAFCSLAILYQLPEELQTQF